MAPIRDFLCMSCGHQWEDIVHADEGTFECPQCTSNKVDKLITAHGGYQGNCGASTRPRSAGSFKKAKR